MAKFIVWYQLQLKDWCRKPACWLELVGMLLLVILIQNIQLPTGDNTAVGLFSIDESVTKELLEQPELSESTFEFYEYHDQAAMEEDVVTGKLECGFAFEEDFVKNWEEGKIDRTITYFSTPLTTKGYVAQETIFVILLKQYSDQMMERQASEVFAEPDEDTVAQLSKWNEAYLNSDAIFDIQIETVEQEAIHVIENKVYPVQGIISMIIFMTMLMNGAGILGNQKQKVAGALDRRNQAIFAYTNNIAVATLEAVVGLAIILVRGNHRGVITELIAMVGLIVISSIWVLLFGRFFQNEITFASTTLAIILVNLIICPVFINLAQYVPVLRYLSCCFPVGIYLFF